MQIASFRRALTGALTALGISGCAPHAGGVAATTPAAAPVAAEAVTPPRTSFVSPYSYEWFVRAELYRARGQPAAAAEAYEAALSSADDDAYLLARKAEALDLAGDAAGAEGALASALAIDPEAEAAWLARGRIAERHATHDSRGVASIDLAITAYERAEAAAPLAQEAPFALARLLREHGHPERALAVLERVAARVPGASSAALRARLELARTHRDGEALAAAARALLAHGSAGAALLAPLATELLAQQRPALAARVLAVLPETERDPRVELAVLLALMRRGEVEALLATTPPDALGGPLEVADSYLRIGEPARALAALELSRPDEDVYRYALLLGLALLDSGRPVEAVRELARVPAGSAHHDRARQGLEHAFAAAGLPALGREVANARAPEKAQGN